MPEGNARKGCLSPRDGLPSCSTSLGPWTAATVRVRVGGCANPQFCGLALSHIRGDLIPGKELATLPWTLSPLPATGGPLGQSAWDGGAGGTPGEARLLLSPIVATNMGGSLAQPWVQTLREPQGEGLCGGLVPTAGTETEDEPQPPGMEAEPEEGALLGRGTPCSAHGPVAK